MQAHESGQQVSPVAGGETLGASPSGFDWNSFAADYEALGEPISRPHAEQSLGLSGVTPGERVIDVAAGTGALTLAAARSGAKVLAVDFSPGMVARLSDRLRTEGREACEARVMDGQALEIDDARFDAAFSIFGVMLFPDWQCGLTEMARVCALAGAAVSRCGRGGKGRHRSSPFTTHIASPSLTPHPTPLPQGLPG